MLMRAATVVQQLCNSCASLAGLVLCFIACFILLVIAPLSADNNTSSVVRVEFAAGLAADYNLDVTKHYYVIFVEVTRKPINTFVG